MTGDISYRDGRPTSWPNDPYIVLGAEKHDYDNSQYPSFNGYLDELRISTVVRYTANYTPTLTLTDDIHTVALYHFDEGTGTILVNSASGSFDTCNGSLQIGGNPLGPIWNLETTNPLQNSGANTPLQPQINDCNPTITPTFSNGIFEIHTPCSIESLKIHDKDAKTVDFKRYDNRIDISHLPDGLYIISLIVDRSFKSIKG